jgi:hypothetical protein
VKFLNRTYFRSKADPSRTILLDTPISKIVPAQIPNDANAGSLEDITKGAQ